MPSVVHVRAVGSGDTLLPRGDLDWFRREFYRSCTARAAEHRRGHGAMYDALARGAVEPERLRRSLAGLNLPRASDGRIVLAVDVSPWLRSDAPTSADRLFCHIYGRGRTQSQRIPGWPYSFVAALEPGGTSWTALLDAVRLGPADDATAVTAEQLREVVGRLTTARQWCVGDPKILIVTDAGYDITRLAFLLADLPVEPTCPSAPGRP